MALLVIIGCENLAVHYLLYLFNINSQLFCQTHSDLLVDTRQNITSRL